ncbi:hypothetical protein H9P43_007087 [Blastocladiella emersonii ATCC 22665]|nr:hypothetical protein H9P43_007087 [Blastocladiella emersonii ATCC 22665]
MPHARSRSTSSPSPPPEPALLFKPSPHSDRRMSHPHHPPPPPPPSSTASAAAASGLMGLLERAPMPRFGFGSSAASAAPPPPSAAHYDHHHGGHHDYAHSDAGESDLLFDEFGGGNGQPGNDDDGDDGTGNPNQGDVDDDDLLLGPGGPDDDDDDEASGVLNLFSFPFIGGGGGASRAGSTSDHHHHHHGGDPAAAAAARLNQTADLADRAVAGSPAFDANNSGSGSSSGGLRRPAAAAVPAPLNLQQPLPPGLDATTAAEQPPVPGPPPPPLVLHAAGLGAWLAHAASQLPLPKVANLGPVNENSINWLSPLTYLALLTFPEKEAVHAPGSKSPTKATFGELRETHLVRQRRRLLGFLTLYTLVMRYCSFDSFLLLLVFSNCMLLYFMKNSRKINVQMAKKNIKQRVGWAKQWAGGLFKRGGGGNNNNDNDDFGGSTDGLNDPQYSGLAHPHHLRGGGGLGMDGGPPGAPGSGGGPMNGGSGDPAAATTQTKKKKRGIPFRKSPQPANLPLQAGAGATASLTALSGPAPGPAPANSLNGPGGTALANNNGTGPSSAASTGSAKGAGRRINIFRRAASVEPAGDKANPFHLDAAGHAGSSSNAINEAGASASAGLAGAASGSLNNLRASSIPGAASAAGTDSPGAILPTAVTAAAAPGTPNSAVAAAASTNALGLGGVPGLAPSPGDAHHHGHGGHGQSQSQSQSGGKFAKMFQRRRGNSSSTNTSAPAVPEDLAPAAGRRNAEANIHATSGADSPCSGSGGAGNADAGTPPHHHLSSAETLVGAAVRPALAIPLPAAQGLGSNETMATLAAPEMQPEDAAVPVLDPAAVVVAATPPASLRPLLTASPATAASSAATPLRDTTVLTLSGGPSGDVPTPTSAAAAAPPLPPARNVPPAVAVPVAPLAAGSSSSIASGPGAATNSVTVLSDAMWPPASTGAKPLSASISHDSLSTTSSGSPRVSSVRRNPASGGAGGGGGHARSSSDGGSGSIAPQAGYHPRLSVVLGSPTANAVATAAAANAGAVAGGKQHSRINAVVGKAKDLWGHVKGGSSSGGTVAGHGSDEAGAGASYTATSAQPTSSAPPSASGTPPSLLPRGVFHQAVLATPAGSHLESAGMAASAAGVDTFLSPPRVVASPAPVTAPEQHPV